MDLKQYKYTSKRWNDIWLHYFTSQSHKMRVLIAGCGLAGLATALGLATKEENIEIVIVERRDNLESRGATLGLARNGQLSLQEIAPSSVLENLKAIGIYMEMTGGYMLPWWKVRDVLMETVQEISPYKDVIRIHLGCVIKEVKNLDQDEMPLKVSFESSTSSSTFSSSTLHHQEQEFDVLIGADGVHSQIRTQILKLPPPVLSDTVVWRGSVDTNSVAELQYFQEYPVGKVFALGADSILACFNFHSQLPGIVAWVFSCRNAARKKIVSGITTPLDILMEYQSTLTEGEEQSSSSVKATELRDAIRLLENTYHPSELTWSTEMAVVDLDFFQDQERWGGKGRVTLIGDAAHSIRPASGLGGSLAFEDAALLSRALISPMVNSMTIAERLARFEAQRLPRCQSISRDQTLRSTLAYKLGFNKVPAWDPAYEKWIWDGPNASSHPPVDERDVFSSILNETSEGD